MRALIATTTARYRAAPAKSANLVDVDDVYGECFAERSAAWTSGEIVDGSTAPEASRRGSDRIATDACTGRSGAKSDGLRPTIRASVPVSTPARVIVPSASTRAPRQSSACEHASRRRSRAAAPRDRAAQVQVDLQFGIRPLTPRSRQALRSIISQPLPPAAPRRHRGETLTAPAARMRPTTAVP